MVSRAMASKEVWEEAMLSEFKGRFKVFKRILY